MRAMNEARNSPYPSDLTDAEWAVLEPLMPPPAATGRPLKWTRRQMAEAIFYLLRSGCSWRMLPRHFPPWNTVHSQLLRWRDDGTLQRLHNALRDMTRAAAGRAEEPAAAIVESQTARADDCRGTDAATRAVKPPPAARPYPRGYSRSHAPGLRSRRQRPQHKRLQAPRLNDPICPPLDVLAGNVIGRGMQRLRHQEFIRFRNAVEVAVPAGKIVHPILDNYAVDKHPKVHAWLDCPRAGLFTSP